MVLYISVDETATFLCNVSDKCQRFVNQYSTTNIVVLAHCVATPSFHIFLFATLAVVSLLPSNHRSNMLLTVLLTVVCSRSTYSPLSFSLSLSFLSIPQFPLALSLLHDRLARDLMYTTWFVQVMSLLSSWFYLLFLWVRTRTCVSHKNAPTCVSHTVTHSSNSSLHTADTRCGE